MGDWVPANQDWEGTFNQGQEVPLAFSRGQPDPWPVIEGLDGIWAGTAELNGAKLRQVLSFTTTPERGTVITYSSPDQLVMGVPVAKFARKGKAVSFSLLKGISSFAGKFSDNGKQLSGTFSNTLNDNKTEVTFYRVEQAAAETPPKRPQEPKGPFPYKAEEVGFDNPDWLR